MAVCGACYGPERPLQLNQRLRQLEVCYPEPDQGVLGRWSQGADSVDHVHPHLPVLLCACGICGDHDDLGRPLGAAEARE